MSATAPNLFKFAPSELSQDAFFLWLFNFANDKFISGEHFVLNQVALDMLLAMVRKTRPHFNIDAQHLEVLKQFKITIDKKTNDERTNDERTNDEKTNDKKTRRIDMVVVVNEGIYHGEFRLGTKIFIESKTNSKEHGNQLYDYVKYGLDKELDFVCIYLKTGNESLYSMQQIHEKTSKLGVHFTPFNRQDILSIMNRYHDIDNDIYQAYLGYLQEIEDNTQSYRKLPIKEWSGYAWQGFFMALEQHAPAFWWDFVQNPNGGFWAADLIKITDKQHPIYGEISAILAIHERKLVYGISVENESSRVEIRDKLSEHFLSKVEEFNQSVDANALKLNRPIRFGKGKFMKVAEVQQQFWLGDDDTIIDTAQKVEWIWDTLRLHMRFFSQAVADFQVN